MALIALEAIILVNLKGHLRYLVFMLSIWCVVMYNWLGFLYRRFIIDTKVESIIIQVFFWIFMISTMIALPIGLNYFSELEPGWMNWIMLLFFGSNLYLVIAFLLFFIIDFVLARLKTGFGYSKIMSPKMRVVIALIFLMFMATISTIQAAKLPEVTRVTIPLKKLPKAAEGFTILQLSDTHLGPIKSKKFLNYLVGKIKEINPNMVIITGDLSDSTPSRLHNILDSFEDIRGKIKYGMFFVTGNHEYYHGATLDWIAELNKYGIKSLHNDLVPITEKGEVLFELLGVDDISSHNFDMGHGSDMKKAMANHDPRYATILLAHNPNHIYETVKYNISLQISGHTHGGQLWPVNFIAYFFMSFVEGYHVVNENTAIYVNRGTGTWGPPLRNIPSEITLITLSRA